MSQAMARSTDNGQPSGGTAARVGTQRVIGRGLRRGSPFNASIPNTSCRERLFTSYDDGFIWYKHMRTVVLPPFSFPLSGLCDAILIDVFHPLLLRTPLFNFYQNFVLGIASFASFLSVFFIFNG